jgi:hypothetical protein
MSGKAIDEKSVFLLSQEVWVEVVTIEKFVDISNRHQDDVIISPLHLNGTYLDFEKKLQ